MRCSAFPPRGGHEGPPFCRGDGRLGLDGGAALRRRRSGPPRSTLPATSGPSWPRTVSPVTGPMKSTARPACGSTCATRPLKKLEDGKTAIVPGHAEAERTGPADHDGRSQTTACRRPTPTRPSRKEQIGLLTRWVAEGARYSLHWSFEKPVACRRAPREPCRLDRQPGRPLRSGEARRRPA